MRLHYFYIFFIAICVTISEYLIYILFNNIGISNNIYVEKIFYLLGMILPILFMITMLYGQKHASFINSWIYKISTLWFGMIFYIFTVILIITILTFLNSLFILGLPIILITKIQVFRYSYIQTLLTIIFMLHYITL